MKIIECTQGTEEWFEARRGVATASQFDKIITPKTGKPSAQSFGYICQLIAEKMVPNAPEAIEAYSNHYMEYGVNTEPEARDYYAFRYDTEVQQVGFCMTDDEMFGCSPDGLVGAPGGLELKCPALKTHVGYLLAGSLPAAYKCQVHGSLYVTGREWWDFMSYAVGLPPFLLRVYPDEFTEQMGEALKEFTIKYEEAWERITRLAPDEAQIALKAEKESDALADCF
jgi:putative phage-type endonuclease